MERSFKSSHVNILYEMVARHYPRPFRFVCITDAAAGLDAKIEALPLPAHAGGFSGLKNPSGARFPNCYCRLWNFSAEAAALLGPRIFQIDIDVIITGDLRPLVDREEDFVGWSDKRFEEHKIAGGAYLLKSGSMKQIWTDFDPASSPAKAAAAGFKGSDQGWMSFRLSVGAKDLSPLRVGFWKNEGLVKINWTEKRSRIPPREARIVFTSGVKPPWAKETRTLYPWVREYWQNAESA